MVLSGDECEFNATGVYDLSHSFTMLFFALQDRRSSG
jgi:hypothetical protein